MLIALVSGYLLTKKNAPFGPVIAVGFVLSVRIWFGLYLKQQGAYELSRLPIHGSHLAWICFCRFGSACLDASAQRLPQFASVVSGARTHLCWSFRRQSGFCGSRF